MSGEKLTTFVKTHPVSVTCGVLTVLLLAGVYFRKDQVTQADATLEERTALAQRIDANIKNGVQLAEQLASITTARQEIESRLVRADELAKNQQYFYKVESETGVKLVDIRQNSPANKPKAKTLYQPVNYSVVIRGTYAHVLDFLRRLESGQRFCRVTSASINLMAAGEGERGKELNVTLGLDLLGQP